MPRKTSATSTLNNHVLPASMRPRPDAAENGESGRLEADDGGASMRPRPDAAENAIEAERGGPVVQASMRPRPDAAENYRHVVVVVARRPGFNEAAARCRGKQDPNLRPQSKRILLQ